MLVLPRKTYVPKYDFWSIGVLREGVIILERSMGALDNDAEVGSWNTWRFFSAETNRTWEE